MSLEKSFATGITFDAIPQDNMSIIVSWFVGTEYPITNIDDIKDIRVANEIIFFWYNNQLRECPARSRNKIDIPSFSLEESFDIEMLKMRVLGSYNYCMVKSPENPNVIGL